MERMTRTEKYKELRESMKKEIVSFEETPNYQPKQEVKQEPVVVPTKVEDTLVAGMTFDSIVENEEEDVKRALAKVREDAGQEAYDTRTDILNKIRSQKLDELFADEEDQEEVVETNNEVVVEEPKKEIIDEISFEDEVVEEAKPNRFGYVKEQKVEQVEEVKQPETKVEKINEVVLDEKDEDEEPEQKDGVFVKLLNGVIIVLAIVLVGLIGFICKELFF